MKKIILITALSVFGFSVYSQSDDQKVSLGLRAGINFQNLNGKDQAGNKLENKIIPGFNAGVTVDFPLVPDFFLQSGLLFTTKGAKLNGTEAKIHLNYLELPINFIYKPLLGTGHLLLGFGPYLAYGVGGKLSSDAGDVKIKFKNEQSAGIVGSVLYFKPFDAGANLLFGYEFSNHLSIQLNAQLGLLNINTKHDIIDVSGVVVSDKRVVKNTGFGLSAGYRF